MSREWRSKAATHFGLLIWAVTVVACGATAGGPDGSDGSDGADDGPTDSGSEAAAPDMGGTADEAGEESGGDGDDGGGCSFANCDDTPAIEKCDPRNQDCPPGEKCSAAASSGGTWDVNVCVPIVDDPVGVGEACFVIGALRDGHDNCELGSICFDVDEEGDGTCFAFCQGDLYECPPGSSCHATGDGTVDLCRPDCDPLLQDCAGGQLCVSVNSGFRCVPDASEGQGFYGIGCQFVNSCNPGLSCAVPELVPGCADPACCTPFCDLDAAEPCPDQDLGVSCIAFFEEGEALPHQEHIGICGLG